MRANLQRIADPRLASADHRAGRQASGRFLRRGDRLKLLEAQAKVYHDIVALCLEDPRCTAIQTWGFTDKYSWIPRSSKGFGAALEFDQDYQAKPAYGSIKAAFRELR